MYVCVQRYDQASEKPCRASSEEECPYYVYWCELNFMAYTPKTSPSEMSQDDVAQWAFSLQQNGVGADLTFRKNISGLYYWAE
ncbi:hypothetical protein AAVH_37181, partial [Aphelenchoides avenae]